jgi:hypothetical protein
MRITSKAQFYDLWTKGVLGNRTRVWTNVEDALKSRCPQIGFREVGRGGGGAWESGSRADARDTAARWTRLGRRFIMDDGAPSSHAILQGEVCRTFEGLQSYLAVGHGIPPMRISMARGMHTHRGYLATKILLDEYMDPSSRDDLDSLLELYPDHTIEFTSFDIDVGNIPNRNTLIWETRLF